MLAMKTELLISLLCVTLSAADVAVADVQQEEAALPASEGASSNCPQGWQPYQDNCYLLVNLTYSWSNAEFLCESLGASLASAHNLWEDRFLKQLAWKAGFLTAWIGGYRFQGFWRWDDGTPFNYNNWYSHNSPSSYDCLYLNSQDSRGWSNVRCHLGHPFICSLKVIYC
ncbi:type-2 ice-structuring protein-like isoform X2 [Pempheris klunzingeri]|uniref:type-2 ice-structuring protein-like isoform X2 n=1 Tax=Pempheris klunzingeri TaxID=3127111 RepID=UPI00397F5630